MELRVSAILFLSELAFGTVAFTMMFLSSDIKRSFHRFNLISASILWLLVTALAWGQSSPFFDDFHIVAGAVVSAIVAAFLGHAINKYEMGRGLKRIAIVWFIPILIVIVFPLSDSKILWIPSISRLLMNVVTGMVLLGSVHVGMILGHWYLIMRNLSFEHLIKASKLFLWAIIIRTVWTAVEFAIVDVVTRERWLGPDAMFVMMRVAWGLAMPLVLAFFTLRLAKTKNNQAATGMLYVCEFCVLGGEAIAAYLRM